MEERNEDFFNSQVSESILVNATNFQANVFVCLRCCTDLKDDDMEVTIVRGLSYNVPNPKTIDTYVRFEIPLPSTVRRKAFQTRPIYQLFLSLEFRTTQLKTKRERLEIRIIPSITNRFTSP